MGEASVIDQQVAVYSGNIYTNMLRGNLVHTSTVMLSRERFDHVKGFDEGLNLSGEDYDFHFRTCKWGDVCFVDAPSTIYQIGFDDRLTKHSRQIALNFLKTVEGAIAREAGTSQFPPAMVDDVLAEAHEWNADELFKAKDYAGVRHHAWLSLRRRFWQPRLILLLALASLPRWISAGALGTYRKTKKLIAG
jgi:hypothetical protein